MKPTLKLNERAFGLTFRINCVASPTYMTKCNVETVSLDITLNDMGVRIGTDIVTFMVKLRIRHLRLKLIFGVITNLCL